MFHWFILFVRFRGVNLSNDIFVQAERQDEFPNQGSFCQESSQLYKVSDNGALESSLPRKKLPILLDDFKTNYSIRQRAIS